MKSRIASKVIIMMMLLFISLGANNCTTSRSVYGNENEISKNITVDSFTAIDASSSFEISVVIGKQQSVVIKTDENIFQYLRVYVKNNTLYLATANNVNIHDDIDVEITVPELNKVDLSGACEIDVKNISGKSFSVDASGAADGELKGNVKNLYLDLSGAAEFDTKDLKAENVIVDASGAVDLEIFCSDSLNLDLSGASEITIYGHPNKVKSDISGSSSVNYK